MKSLLTAITLSILFPLCSIAQNIQAEIESTIKVFTESFLNEDYEKSMSYWNNSDDIVYISDDRTYNTKELRSLYEFMSENIESLEILEQTIKTTSIGQYKALCIWQGKEKIKMKDREAIESNWISTFIMENKKGRWIILHGHTTHY
ncbi:MAG: nuclear transport factor 2 family protein [Bacteroidales bacterium]|nr:nuclear transport factor 2 family protein [Bacteroidales bacterium]